MAFKTVDLVFSVRIPEFSSIFKCWCNKGGVSAALYFFGALAQIALNEAQSILFCCCCCFFLLCFSNIYNVRFPIKRFRKSDSKIWMLKTLSRMLITLFICFIKTFRLV